MLMERKKPLFNQEPHQEDTILTLFKPRPPHQEITLLSQLLKLLMVTKPLAIQQLHHHMDLEPLHKSQPSMAVNQHGQKLLQLTQKVITLPGHTSQPSTEVTRPLSITKSLPLMEATRHTSMSQPQAVEILLT
jgi:hypothetical protein